MVGLIHSFEAGAVAGTPRSLNDADPVLQRFETVDAKVAQQALPELVKNVASPYPSVRGLVSMALLAISMRPDSAVVLSSTGTNFIPLLSDQEIPVRRVTAIAFDNMILKSSSYLLPSIQSYLMRYRLLDQTSHSRS